MKKSSIYFVILMLSIMLIADTSYARGKKRGKKGSNRSGSSRSSSGKSVKNNSNKNKSFKSNSNKNKSFNKNSNKNKSQSNKHSHKFNKGSSGNRNKNYSGSSSKSKHGHNNKYFGSKNYSNKSWSNHKHYDHHHDHWHHGHWDNRHHNSVAVGVGIWGAWSMGSRIYSSGYNSYSNPYYVQESSVVNYSVPIDSSVVNDPAESVTILGMAEIDLALNEFKNDRYNEALTHANTALKSLPNDIAIHEVRSLILFAIGNYQEAASGIYSMLSVGPGWDWKTMSSLYSSTSVYTSQLRQLESFCKSNPKDSSARFLLAYHYITCGHTSHALTELKVVSRLNPEDQLAKKLIDTFNPEEKPAPSTPPAPGTTASPNNSNTVSSLGNAASSAPVTKESLTAKWTADRGDQGTITLILNADSSYIWEFKSKTSSDSIKGTYAVGGNILTLIDSNGRPMVGNVSQAAPDQFHFKLSGNGPNDPGLDFKK